MNSLKDRQISSSPAKKSPRILFLAFLFCWIMISPGTHSFAADQAPAQKLMDSGHSAFQHGQFGDAAEYFNRAALAFEHKGAETDHCRALLAASQAGYFIGQHRLAREQLEQALALAREINDEQLVARTLNALGNVTLAQGDLSSSEKYLSEALSAARRVADNEITSAILISQGNLQLAENQSTLAITSYREGEKLAATSGQDNLLSQALINGAEALLSTEQFSAAKTNTDRAVTLLKAFDNTTQSAHALVNCAKIYSRLRAEISAENQTLLEAALNAYSMALKKAEAIQDNRSTSYAYGYMARLYAEENQLSEALTLTQKAIFSAQISDMSEALYLWHWQAGQVETLMGKMDEAIRSYRLAMYDLRAIRDEMSSCYGAPQSSYRTEATLISSELVDLLLQRASELQAGEDIEPYLIEARDTLEIRKVYELREYFKDDCLDATREVSTKADVISAKAVVIYPVLLPDRVELLVSFSGKLKRYILPVGVEELNREAYQLRSALMKRTTWEFLPHAQKLYDWIIRPMEQDLRNVKAKTLVFVPDGALRTIPMSVLHNGDKFLIENYPLAITPSLILTDPKPLNPEDIHLLAMGVTQPVQGFSGLPYVVDEIAAITDLYGGDRLMNDHFKLASVETALKKQPYSIVHIASHGHFGANVDETYLLTFDEKLRMDRFGRYVGLYRFRETPLDLITLSACETAAGDDKAALGLAGVAVRAGARSALATLWHVNDPASYQLVAEFYRQLARAQNSRAEALRQAQLKLLADIRYDHPGYWAPFLLIGNWL